MNQILVCLNQGPYKLLADSVELCLCPPNPWQYYVDLALINVIEKGNPNVNLLIFFGYLKKVPQTMPQTSTVIL